MAPVCLEQTAGMQTFQSRGRKSTGRHGSMWREHLQVGRVEGVLRPHVRVARPVALHQCLLQGGRQLLLQRRPGWVEEPAVLAHLSM